MFLFRLLTTGVCVACVIMLTTLHPVCVEVTQPSVIPDRAPPISIIDVAGSVAPGALASLVHLQPTEWVSAINDRALDCDQEADALIASLAPHTGEFLDLTVTSATTQRRVLLLMH